MVAVIRIPARASLDQQNIDRLKAMPGNMIEIESEELTIHYAFADPRRENVSHWRPRGDLNP